MVELQAFNTQSRTFGMTFKLDESSILAFADASSLYGAGTVLLWVKGVGSSLPDHSHVWGPDVVHLPSSPLGPPTCVVKGDYATFPAPAPTPTPTPTPAPSA